jgi:hypothetical protein
MDSQTCFEQTFTGPASAVRARIWQQVYGPEYPAWADPFSYVSVTELRRFVGWTAQQGLGRMGWLVSLAG